MAYDFNVDEIFEIAEQIERNGARFYRHMAENVSESDLRQLFLDLAGMEEEHERIFISMRTGLSEKDKKPTVFDPKGESAQYLRSLADLRVFDKKAEDDFAFTGMTAEQEKIKMAIRAAVGIEKESIVFYVGMKEFVPENLGKNKIDTIIKEEMKHIRLLSKRLTSS
jgi:rubrerythrin